MDKELKVGIVGLGGAGLAQYDHFRSLGCNVTAVYDPKAAALERARGLAQPLVVTDDFEKFIAAGIDIAAICSPDSTHAQYMVRCIRAGIHAICEKPLTDSVEGYREILKAEKESPGVVAAAQHQMRFLPLHIKIRQAIETGTLGKISYIEGYYVHNLTQRAELYDDWRFKDNATPLVYSGCHFVDLLRWLLNDEVVEVTGMANNIAFPAYPESDLNVVLLRFRSGVIGKVITAFGAARPQDHSVRVYGTEKSIENNLLYSKEGRFSVLARPFFSDDGRTHHPSFRNRLGSIRANYKAALLGMVFEGLMQLWSRKDREYQIGSYPMRLYEHSYAVKASISDFLSAIRTGRKPLATVTEAAKTVATCLAGVEAYRTGRTVPVANYWLSELNDRNS